MNLTSLNTQYFSFMIQILIRLKQRIVIHLWISPPPRAPAQETQHLSNLSGSDRLPALGGQIRRHDLCVCRVRMYTHTYEMLSLSLQVSNIPH